MCQATKFADITVISLGGRPPTYSEAITTTICHRIGQGKSLRQVCLAPDIPSKATVMRWLALPAHEEFRQKYRLACWLREQTIMDEILEIADDTSNDTISPSYSSEGAKLL